MKLTKPILFLSLLFYFTVLQINAQDIIKLNNGKEYKCDIDEIKSDTIYFTLDYNGSISKTHVLKSDVTFFVIGQIEKLKNNMDSTAYYSIEMDNGSTLKGKIISFNESSILISDNNLGAINVKAEKIRNIEKEDPDAFLKIELNNGNVLNGRIIERKANVLVLKTDDLGVIDIPTNNIKKITEINEANLKNGEYWFPNPNSSRYFFGPSGISLKKGEGYYQNIYLAYNSVSYGLTDYFSIGGGVILPVAAFITPKLSFKIAPKFYLGAGTLLGIGPGNTVIGVVYGIATYGSVEHNITLGSGFGFYDDTFQEKPIITLAAMTRVSPKIALVTENWMVPYNNYEYINGQQVVTIKYNGLVSYGIRLMSEKNYSFDFAFINSQDIVDVFFIGIPYIDFVLRF
jgi:hypothetical protein